VNQNPLTVAWIPHFPIEWLSDAPEPFRHLPREHPLSWQRVLLAELENVPGLRLHILVLRKQFERNFVFERNGVTFHLIKAPGGLRAPSLFWVDTILIRQVLNKIKPDVVHAWGTERGAALVASRLKYPSVVTMQGLLTWINELTPLNWYHRFAAILEKWSLSRAPIVTTESTFAVQYLQSRFSCPNVQQVEHAPDWIFHRLERKPKIAPLRFIFVGTLSHLKGTDLLLMALDRLKDELTFELLMAGGPERNFMEKIRSQISDKLWRRIQFKQELQPAEIAAELATATLMIFPTRADTSPNSVKEAVVAGLPVVASAVGGIPDYVIPGRNGILFRAGELKELIEAVRAACRHPLFSHGMVEPDVLARMRDYLSPVRMGKRFLEIYEIARRQKP
jgi:glycosyltransferase involved in cell wall biosynthesis